MNASTAEHAGTPKTRVFLSYSRADRLFAEKLRDRLIANSFDAFLDVHDIVKGEPWQERLQNLIFGADAVAFLISPDSVVSEVCDWEINEAERLSKRVLPVMCRPTPDETIPGRLRRLNYAFLDAEDNWAREYRALCTELSRDIVWVREHTRLSERAALWDRAGRPQEEKLLNADESRDARAWELRRPTDAALSDLLLAFLKASEDKHAKDRKRLLTITGRAFVNPAEQALDQGRYDAALRLAAAGVVLSEDFDNALVPERANGIVGAASGQTLLYVLQGHDGAITSTSFSADGRRIVTASEDKTARVWEANSGREIAVLLGHEGAVKRAAFSQDGTRVLTVSDDKTARVWDALSGRETSVLRGRDGGVSDASFRSDGARIVTAAQNTSSYGRVAAVRSPEKNAYIWDVASERELITLAGHKGDVRSALFSRDGRQILTASGDGTARLWDATSGREVAVLRAPHGFSMRRASFSADGTRILTESEGQDTHIWHATSRRRISTLRGTWSASFSPDGRRVVAVSGGGFVHVWDAASGREIVMLHGRPGGVLSASFSPDGSRIVTASNDGSISVFDAVLGHAVAVWSVQEGTVESAAFSPDGQHIFTERGGKSAHVWDAAAAPLIAMLPENWSRAKTAQWRRGRLREAARARGRQVGAFIERPVSDTHGMGIVQEARTRPVAVSDLHQVLSAAFSSDGARIVTASKAVRVWEALSGREIAVLGTRKDETIYRVSFSPDDTRIVGVSFDAVGIWDAASGHEIALIQGKPGHARGASFSPDGARIVMASDDKTARVWDAVSGQALVVLRGHEGDVGSVSFSPDSTRIVTASDDHTARLWDAVSGRELAALRGHEGRVRSLSFSPNGACIVTASDDKTARVWDAVSGQELLVLRGHEGGVRTAFCLGDKRILTISEVARLWDAASGREIAVLRDHQGDVRYAFSPDGAQIVTMSTGMTTRTPGGGVSVKPTEDRAARVWEARSGREISVLRGHTGPLKSAAFSPDGARILTVSDDKTARVWDAVSGREIAMLQVAPGPVHGATFSPDGMRIVTAHQDEFSMIWDVSHTAALVGDPIEVLAASLTNGRGIATDNERADLLMQTAPHDLYAALMTQLSPAQRERVARRADILSRPLHPNCYLPVVQLGFPA